MSFFCKMTKILPVIWLAIFAAMASQSLYAHNADPDIEKRATEREQEKDQKDRDTWDDFMKAVNEQEAKETATENSDHEDSHKR